MPRSANSTRLSDMGQREAILCAAETEFKSFGYHKTSMIEIAKGCDISAAHLYNFFDNKLDIASALALRVNRAIYDDVGAMIGTSDAEGNLEQIRLFLLAELRETYALLDNHPKLCDFFDIIVDKRPETANQTLFDGRKLLEKLVESGMEQEEIGRGDARLLAEYIQAATVKYRYPQWTSTLSLTQLERELAGVSELLVNGLAR